MLTLNTNQDCMQCTRYCNIFWINNKMICKALAFRLLTLSMVGFKARHFSENCKSSLGTTNPNNTAIILSLDTEKRFDRVSWSFFSSHPSTNLDSSHILSAVSKHYTAPSLHARTNGPTSKPLLARGTRQVCPLSPLLFALFIVPLAAYRRQSDSCLF